MKEKITKNLTLIVFLIMIFGTAIINIILPDRKFSDSENRVLQEMPEFSLSALFDGSFTADYETYVTDQFMLRDSFVGIKVASEHLLYKKDTNGVYFGKDGYLIEKHDYLNTDMEIYDNNLAELGLFLNDQAEKLSSEHVFFMAVPTADNIFSEKLPLFAPFIDQQACFNKIINDETRKFTYVDVLSKLKEHNDEYIYYKTDHHWTTKGAYYGYEAFCDAANIISVKENEFEITLATDSFLGTIYSKAHLSSTKPDSIYIYNKKSNPKYTLDYNMGQKSADSLYDLSYLEKRDKYSVFLGGNHALVTINSEDVSNDKSLLVIKDSYAHSIIPFLVNNYETIHMIDLRYYNGDIDQFMSENEITDVLALYNFATLSDDKSFSKLNK